MARFKKSDAGKPNPNPGPQSLDPKPYCWALRTEGQNVISEQKPHDNLRESTVRRSREVWGLRLRPLESSSKAFAKVLENLLQDL